MFDLHLSRNRHAKGTLVDQIVDAVAAALGAGAYPAGTVLPSVRGFAKTHALSPYTVAEAYQRLVSMGLIVSRAGSGYRVASRQEGAPRPAPTRIPPSLNAAWLLSDVYADQSVPIKAGGGWIPEEWVNESGLQHALRSVGRLPGARIGTYGHPYGFGPLREYIGASLQRHALAVDASNVLLTHGATQALDLIVRTLLRAGDTVVVEDPCYCNLLQILKLGAIRVVSVRRTVEGLDLDELEQVLAVHRPKALFVNPVLQNPSGASLSIASAFRLLQIADRHRLWIVEDDISRELAPLGAPCLAAMEGLKRVIYVSGFSKTITPAVRAGYIAAERALLAQLARTKMAVGLTSSEVTERTVANVLIEGHYERHVALVRERLAAAHERVILSMREAGLDVFHTPGAGLFLWAKAPVAPEAAPAVATAALAQGIWLAPGSYFRADEAPSAWFRFNVPASDVPRLWEFMRALRARTFDLADAQA